MPVCDAVKEASDGVLIDLEITPGTKTIKLPSGYNPWRKRIEVKLSEAAQKGKANEQLIEQLSEFLGIKESDITLVSGRTSHKKTVHIKGLDPRHIIDVFGQLIEKE